MLQHGPHPTHAWSALVCSAANYQASGTLIGGLLLIGAALALVAPAAAQDGIFNVVNNLSSLSSNSPNDSEASTEFAIHSDAVAGANQSFTSRYGFNVNADSKSTSRSKMASAVHEVDFEVHSSRPYSLVVSSGWVGQMTRQADAPECADAVTLSGVDGEVVGGFGVSSGSLSLSDPPDITLQTSGDATLDISEVADATITVTNPNPVEFHRLRFSWNAAVLSNTCEVAVRLGGDVGTTTECVNCGYPGDPPRDQTADGHFVNVQYMPSNCGNGQLDSGEECDLGAGNGFAACCDVHCKLEPQNMPCDDGLFCNGDGRCDASGICQPLGNPCTGLPGCQVCDEAADACVPCSGTPTATATAETSISPTATATVDMSASPTPTATPSVATTIDPFAVCPGDCNDDQQVAINELVVGVNIALGAANTSTCSAADTDGNGAVVISELVTSVNRALAGCFGSLAGSWFGPFTEFTNFNGVTQTLTIDSGGVVTGPLPATLRAPLTVLDRANRVYTFHRSDGVTGALLFAADGRHALYVDAVSGFGALQKDASALASYSDDDLGDDFWSGSAVHFDAQDDTPALQRFEHIDRAAAFVGTLSEGRFHLRGEDVDVATLSVPLSLTSMLPSLGVFQGNWNAGNIGRPALFFITPDKTFFAAQTCVEGFSSCLFSTWSRAVGSYAATCASCQATLPPGIACSCLTSEQLFVDTFIPLPCLGSIENIEGTLMCR
jgi:hypothetical protein